MKHTALAWVCERSNYIVIAIFIAAILLSTVVAGTTVRLFEELSARAVRDALEQNEQFWTTVHSDGLRIILSGEAPSESQKLLANSTARTVVDTTRVIDHIKLATKMKIGVPDFSAEVLRNDSGITVAGLIPSTSNRSYLISRIESIAEDLLVVDLLETANHAAPPLWNEALSYTLTALALLPQAKISIEPGKVQITAVAGSYEEKKIFETLLMNNVPADLQLLIDIAVPRPVITPFTLHYILDHTGGRFETCSAPDYTAQLRILAAAQKSSLSQNDFCVIGLGVPSSQWTEAVEHALAAISELEAGSVEFSNIDITLIGPPGIDKQKFDHIIDKLKRNLPAAFLLTATLPLDEDSTNDQVAEFIATLSPEGLLQLRGKVNDETFQKTTSSFAQAKFGATNVHNTTRIVEGLPSDWPLRILTGLEALASLEYGALHVLIDNVIIKGATYKPDRHYTISQELSNKLGDTIPFKLNITILEEPKVPEISDITVSAEDCVAQLNDILSEQKISFEPGSATMTFPSHEIIDTIADILRNCDNIPLEIQGHTDSQGRTAMNKQLSQMRAESVIDELRLRDVETASFVAVGYGEQHPIADNSNKDGREVNRRIEFHLFEPERSTEQEFGATNLKNTQ